MFIKATDGIRSLFFFHLDEYVSLITYYNNIRAARHFDMLCLVRFMRFRGERTAISKTPLGQLKERSKERSICDAFICIRSVLRKFK